MCQALKKLYNRGLKLSPGLFVPAHLSEGEKLFMNIETKSVLRKHNLHPTKSLGQNFLTDDRILEGIIRAAELTKNDIVLEIGPGLGSLTCGLAENAGTVIAVEIDKRLIPVLNENLKAYSNVHIINADILRIDPADELERFIGESGDKGEDKGDASQLSLKVVANLPYYITTPVIMKLLESGIKAKTMVFMVQKEVADRMKAKPGGKDYGALSVAVQYHSKPSVVLEVPPHSFIPQPDVYSSVIKLEVYEKPPVELADESLFFRLVKAAFGQRRKTLVNALSNSGNIGAVKEQIKEMLNYLGIGENQRGETLSIEQFARLANIIAERHQARQPESNQ